MKRLYRLALWVSCGLYLAACALPATSVFTYSGWGGGGTKHYEIEYGWECLAFGWMLVPNGFEDGMVGLLAWLANPLALVGVGLLVFRRPTGAAVLGATSVIVGSLYVILPPPGQDGHPHLPQVGAYLWLGSLLALTFAALIRCGRLQKPAELLSQPIA
jgi:hypothetical protein